MDGVPACLQPSFRCGGFFRKGWISNEHIPKISFSHNLALPVYWIGSLMQGSGFPTGCQAPKVKCRGPNSFFDLGPDLLAGLTYLRTNHMNHSPWFDTLLSDTTFSTKAFHSIRIRGREALLLSRSSCKSKLQAL